MPGLFAPGKKSRTTLYVCAAVAVLLVILLIWYLSKHDSKRAQFTPSVNANDITGSIDLGPGPPRRPGPYLPQGPVLGPCRQGWEPAAVAEAHALSVVGAASSSGLERGPLQQAIDEAQDSSYRLDAAIEAPLARASRR